VNAARSLAAIALAAAVAGGAAAAAPDVNPYADAFVVTYRCDGDRWLVAGYPAWNKARSEPLRLSWNGGTVLLKPARSADGARYVNRDADLQWWSKGRGGNLNRLSDAAPLLANCVER
jgi:membrane-bound inhibitor of C-type lysozyme